MLEYLTNIAKLCDELSWAQVTDAADSTYDSLRWDNWGLQRISGGFEAGDVILCVISGKKDRNRRIWDLVKQRACGQRLEVLCVVVIIQTKYFIDATYTIAFFKRFPFLLLLKKIPYLRHYCPKNVSAQYVIVISKPTKATSIKSKKISTSLFSLIAHLRP